MAKIPVKRYAARVFPCLRFFASPLLFCSPAFSSESPLSAGKTFISCGRRELLCPLPFMLVCGPMPELPKYALSPKSGVFMIFPPFLKGKDRAVPVPLNRQEKGVAVGIVEGIAFDLLFGPRMADHDIAPLFILDKGIVTGSVDAFYRIGL